MADTEHDIEQVPAPEDIRQYLKIRTDIHELQRSNSEQFDRSVMLVATGGMSLVVAYREVWMSNVSACATHFLSLTIGLLAATICLTIASFLVSQKAFAVQDELARQYYIEGDDKALDKTSGWIWAAIWLPRFYGITLILSVIFASIALFIR